MIRLKSILGRRIDSLEAADYRKAHPQARMVQDVNRTLGIAFELPQQTMSFPIEEWVALLFGYLKDLAEKSAGEPVSDVVISVRH